MKHKRWILKISFNGSWDWDIVQEYSQVIVCKKDAEELKDSIVKAMLIEDNVTENTIFI